MRRIMLLCGLVGCTTPKPRPAGAVTAEQEASVLSLVAEWAQGETASGGDDGATDIRDTDSPTDGPDSGDTGASDGWVVLPDQCSPTTAPVPSPVEQLGEVQNTQLGTSASWFMELVDVTYDDTTRVAWGVGQGGLIAFDLSDPRNPETIAPWPANGQGRFYKLLVEDDVAWVTNRDDGLQVLDVSDPSSATELTSLSADDLEGMWKDGDVLYVADMGGALRSYDVSDPNHVNPLGSVSGLGVPWHVLVEGDVAYVADGTLGVGVVDVSDPMNLKLLTTVSVGGGVQNLALGDGVLYTATGGAGIQVLDLSTPTAPTHIGGLDLLGSTVDVAYSDGVLWSVNETDVMAFDVSTPTTLVPLGSIETPEHAKTVTSIRGNALVGDWTRLGVWTVDDTVRQPDLDMSISEWFVRADGDELYATLQNTGATDLHLTGATAPDERFGLAVEQSILAPGESTRLRLQYEGAEEDTSGAICIESNDGDRPATLSTLHTGQAGLHEAIGEAAPDFVLEGLDGTYHHLGSELGHPVVLMFFATWCPHCSAEVSDIEHTIWQAYEDRGVRVWGIASGEHEDTVRNYTERLGVTYPILIDRDGRVFNQFQLRMAFATGAYPQDWVVGTDGVLVYANNRWEPDAMMGVLDRELAE